MARAASTEAPVTRPRKSPADKAQVALDKAQKDHDKALARAAKLDQQADEAQNEVERTARYLNFAKANPDLPPQPDEAQQTTEGTNAAE